MKELKTGITVYAKILWVFSFVVLTVPFLSAFAQLRVFAQSGRGIPAPSTPTPQTPSPNQREVKSKFVIDRSADAYKLVFPTGPGFSSFIEQLNKAGEQGYKLTSVIYRWQRKSASAKQEDAVPVGILKLDEVQHEYAWFETASSSVFAITGFEQKYRELSKRGFRLVDHFLIDLSCEYGNLIVLDQDCELHHLFLLERDKGVEKPKQFIIARSPVRAGFKVRNEGELTAQIKEKLADGFYPSDVFSKWEILLTQTENTDEPSAGSPDVQVVMHLGLKSIEKKVNELAKQGYRLALMNKGTAVMYRHGLTVTPSTYVLLRVNGKSFDERLAKLQESGAVYRMTYAGNGTTKDQLVFEQGLVADGRRQEYKVLNFEFQVVEDLKLRKGGEREVHIDLTASSKETMKLINSLVKEGFWARDLFASDAVSDKVSVLLERTR